MNKLFLCRCCGLFNLLRRKTLISQVRDKTQNYVEGICKNKKLRHSK